MTDTPSIIPPERGLPSAHDIPQALHDSEINFKIEAFFDKVWTATLGDQMNGWGDYSRRPNYVDALLDLKDMAIAKYPDSGFARKFRGVRFLEEADYEDEDALLV